MNQIIEINSNFVIEKSLIAQADDLAAEHEAFNTNYVVGGRQALYGLLAKILELVERFDVAADKAELLDIVRMQLLKQYGIKTQHNTPDITVLVRYITRADRKTAHVYSRAIETARLNQIAPTKFAGYLEQAGGVERIRANSVDEEKSRLCKSIMKEKLELTRKYLDARKEYPIATFQSNEKQFGKLESLDDLNLLVCSEKDGRYYILTKLSVDKVLKAKILEDLAKQLPENIKAVRKNVDRFYRKAMQKRSTNTMKEMLKKKPELAARILKIKNIRNVAISKTKTQ